MRSRLIKLLAVAVLFTSAQAQAYVSDIYLQLIVTGGIKSVASGVSSSADNSTLGIDSGAAKAVLYQQGVFVASGSLPKTWRVDDDPLYLIATASLGTLTAGCIYCNYGILPGFTDSWVKYYKHNVLGGILQTWEDSTDSSEYRDCYTFASGGCQSGGGCW